MSLTFALLQDAGKPSKDKFAGYTFLLNYCMHLFDLFTVRRPVQTVALAYSQGGVGVCPQLAMEVISIHLLLFVRYG